MIPVSFNAANGNKTRSPSSSGGRAGVSISNPPPRLLLVCMVVYIGGGINHADQLVVNPDCILR